MRASVGARAHRALLDDDDLEAVVVLREQRGQQLGQRGEPVERADDDRDARMRRDTP